MHRVLIFNLYLFGFPVFSFLLSLFLLFLWYCRIISSFINDLLCYTLSSTHFHAENSTQHYSASFVAYMSQRSLKDLCDEDVSCLISDLSHISDWVIENIVVFKYFRTQVLYLSTRSNFYHLLFFKHATHSFKPFMSMVLHTLQILFGKIILHILLSLFQKNLVCWANSVIISLSGSCWHCIAVWIAPVWSLTLRCGVVHQQQSSLADWNLKPFV